MNNEERAIEYIFKTFPNGGSQAAHQVTHWAPKDSDTQRVGVGAAWGGTSWHPGSGPSALPPHPLQSAPILLPQP